MIAAGKLDRLITLMSKTTTRDPMGFDVEDWAAIGVIPAERLELRTVDVTRTAGTTGLASGRYRIRWRRGIKTGQRVRIDGADYIVTAVDEPDRRATMIIVVEVAR